MSQYVVQTKSGKVYALFAKSAFKAVARVTSLGEVMVNWWQGEAPVTAEVL